MGLRLKAWIENTYPEEKTRQLSGKEKIFGAAVCKEGHTDSVLKYERTRHNSFPEKNQL